VHRESIDALERRCDYPTGAVMIWRAHVTRAARENPGQRGACRRTASAPVVTVASLLAAYAAPAAAQSQDAGPASAGATGLEEVVVTARRRAENLQDTPVSVTALNAATFERRNLDNLSDISRATPNLIFDTGSMGTGGSANANVYIRGIGQNDFLFTTDPGVGIYVDDVYQPRSVGAVLELADFERVEVLRGPQGTLFGKNTIGGAINITSKRPAESFGVMGEVTAGSRGRLDARFSLDLPVIDDELRLRLSGLTRDQDGYVERIVANDGELGDIDVRAGRLQALWTPDEDWEILFSADVTRRRERSIANELVTVGSPAENPALLLWNALVAPTLGPGIAYDSRYIGPEWKSQGTGPTHSDLDVWGTSLVAQWTPGALSIKSITAYRDQEAEFSQDQDHSPLRYSETDNVNESDFFSQELQLSGTSFGERLDWVTGIFYFEETGSDIFNVYLATGLFDALESLPAAVIPLSPTAVCPPPPGQFDVCAGGAGNPLNIPLDVEATFDNEIETTSYAWYGQGTFDWTDRLSTTLGLRYTRDEKRLAASMFRLNAGVYAYPPQVLEQTWESWSPRLGVEYKFSDALMGYVSAARGFKSGGFNGRSSSLAEITAPFDPELVWTYETGFKSEWFGRRLRLNGAVFWSDYTNMQLTSVQDSNGIIVVRTENAGESQVRGLELEAVAQLGDSLSLNAGVGYMDAEYQELDPGVSVSLDTEFAKTPEWTANAAASYELHLGRAGYLELTGDVSYRSSYYSDVLNSAIGHDDGVALLGARITYLTPSRNWQISLFGTNLSDERYIINTSNTLGSLGTGENSYGRRREWGVSLRADF
jgi:iron complex outermembrane receptor protein